MMGRWILAQLSLPVDMPLYEYAFFDLLGVFGRQGQVQNANEHGTGFTLPPTK
eukprot:COSAG06_NODE_18609_length_877_cov_2.224936_1_plen_52_part_10